MCSIRILFTRCVEDKSSADSSNYYHKCHHYDLPGANGVLTATPQYSGLTPSYQWKKNGINVGTQ